MKITDRFPDFWSDMSGPDDDGPLYDSEKDVTWQTRVEGLSDMMRDYNEETARRQLQARVRTVGWAFMITFVLLFLACVARFS